MSYWKILNSRFEPPLQGGAAICDGKTWPVTLPTVPLDRSGSECGAKGGWHFCRSIEAALKIAGFWRTGRPNAILAVDPVGDVIERADKCRAASLQLIRMATEDEIQAAILRFSAPFGAHAEAMAQEQWLWYQALGRPKHDRVAVLAGLQAALIARSLPWTLREFNSQEAVWAARDARDAWAARAAWAAWAARDAWAARAARDALTVQFSARSAWIKWPSDVLTVGIRDAYCNGLAIAIPTGPTELGWAIEGVR